MELMRLSRPSERSFKHAKQLGWWIWRLVDMFTHAQPVWSKETPRISCLFFHVSFFHFAPKPIQTIL